jgi:hypothetical protein
MTVGSIRHRSDPITEPFPPGTRVSIVRNGASVKGTIANVPLADCRFVDTAAIDTSAAADDSTTNYVVSLDDGTITECAFMELAPKDSPSVTVSSAPSNDPFDCTRNSKITIDHKGQLRFSSKV